MTVVLASIGMHSHAFQFSCSGDGEWSGTSPKGLGILAAVLTGSHNRITALGSHAPKVPHYRTEARAQTAEPGKSHSEHVGSTQDQVQGFTHVR